MIPKILLTRKHALTKNLLGNCYHIYNLSKKTPHHLFLVGRKKYNEYTPENLKAGSPENPPLFQGNIPTQVNQPLNRGWEIPIDWGGGVRRCVASSVPSRCKMVPVERTTGKRIARKSTRRVGYHDNQKVTTTISEVTIKSTWNIPICWKMCFNISYWKWSLFFSGFC